MAKIRAAAAIFGARRVRSTRSFVARDRYRAQRGARCVRIRARKPRRQSPARARIGTRRAAAPRRAYSEQGTSSLLHAAGGRPRRIRSGARQNPRCQRAGTAQRPPTPAHERNLPNRRRRGAGEPEVAVVGGRISRSRATWSVWLGADPARCWSVRRPCVELPYPGSTTSSDDRIGRKRASPSRFTTVLFPLERSWANLSRLRTWLAELVQRRPGHLSTS